MILGSVPVICFIVSKLLDPFDPDMDANPKIEGKLPPNHQFKNRGFPYKPPSILGFSHFFWKHSYLLVVFSTFRSINNQSFPVGSTGKDLFKRYAGATWKGSH